MTYGRSFYALCGIDVHIDVSNLAAERGLVFFSLVRAISQMLLDNHPDFGSRHFKDIVKLRDRATFR